MIAFEQTGSLKFSLHPWLDFARKIAGWCFITFQRRGENCQTWGYESQKVFLRQACIPSSSWTLPSSSHPSTGGTKWSCHRGLYFFQLSQSMFSLVSFTLIIKRGGGSLSWSTLRNVSSHQLPTSETLPKAQRTRGLSSTYQSNFFGSYHKFKHESWSNIFRISTLHQLQSLNQTSPFWQNLNLKILSKPNQNLDQEWTS